MVAKIMPTGRLHMNCSKSFICFEIATLSTGTNPKKLEKIRGSLSDLYIWTEGRWVRESPDGFVISHGILSKHVHNMVSLFDCSLVLNLL